MRKPTGASQRYKNKPRLRHSKDPFVQLPDEVRYGTRYRSLSYAAKALLVALIGEHNGWNNGYLPFSVAWAMDALGTKSRDTAQRACDDLLRSGLAWTTVFPCRGRMRRVALLWLNINVGTEQGTASRSTQCRQPLDQACMPPWTPDLPTTGNNDQEGPRVGSPVSG